LYLVILLIFNFKKITQLNYYILAIKLSKPKIVFTATDNAINFYRLKKIFPSIKFIAIQNGYRSEELFETKKIINNLTCDLIFCLGKQNIDYYKSKIDANVVPIGSMKNNSINAPKNIKLLNCLTYISEYRFNKNIKYNSKNYISQYSLNYYQYKNFIDSEIKIIKLLYLISKEKKLPFYIVGSSLNNQKEEYEWYKNLLNCKNINFRFKRNYKSSYNFLFKSKIIANIDSTLGYEFLARKQKVIFISRNLKDKTKEYYWKFGWPQVKQKKGFFFTNQTNKNEISRILKNVIHMSQKKWISKSSVYRKNLISFDSGNKIFRNYLINFDKQL
jgi:surface carbohydrate biosynthesis protein